MIAEHDLATEWTRLLAPRDGDVRTQLVREAAEFLGISQDEAWARHAGAGERFRQEWLNTITDARDEAALTRFYNQSDTELFELIEWHANDPIHYRTLIVRDLALQRPGRAHLDYGSGIGNDALAFASAGFHVTLADISDLLLAFASWRCRRRGFDVKTIDLKKETPPADAFDSIICFDVLEHVLDPVKVIRLFHRTMRPNGLLVFHAPFADDPEHPMHVAHADVVTPRMRSLGFQPIDWTFPSHVRAPQIYEKRTTPAIERAAYFVYDRYLQNEIGNRLAALYRQHLRRRRPIATMS